MLIGKHSVQLSRSSEVASAGGPFACEVLVKTCADFFVRKDLTAVNLRQTLLDFEHEPFVGADQALDRLASQVLRVRPALLSNSREFSLQFSGKRDFHRASLPEDLEREATSGARSDSLAVQFPGNGGQGATASLAFLAFPATWNLQLAESKGHGKSPNPTLSAKTCRLFSIIYGS